MNYNYYYSKAKLTWAIRKLTALELKAKTLQDSLRISNTIRALKLELSRRA